MPGTKPFTRFMDLDTSTLTCPCGSHKLRGEGTLSEWLRKHLDHTNGKCVDIVTDDGMRCLASRPEPEEWDVIKFLEG